MKKKFEKNQKIQNLKNFADGGKNSKEISEKFQIREIPDQRKYHPEG